MDFVEKILLTKEELSEISERLGKKISDDYKGKNLVIVSLLKGSFIFVADLIRNIKIPSVVDFMAVSSYVGTHNGGGKVNIIKDISQNVEGKDILIVEDILESGHTLRCVVDMFLKRNPKSIKICALLDKPNARKADIQADYVGSVIPDEFVIGYGLDYSEKYRNLPFIGTINPKYI